MRVIRGVLLVVAAMAAISAGCASTGDEFASPVASTKTSAVVVTSESVVTSAPVDLPTGREAIVADEAEGSAYVLWFWGAH